MCQTKQLTRLGAAGHQNWSAYIYAQAWLTPSWGSRSSKLKCTNFSFSRPTLYSSPINLHKAGSRSKRQRGYKHKHDATLWKLIAKAKIMLARRVVCVGRAHKTRWLDARQPIHWLKIVSDKLIWRAHFQACYVTARMQTSSARAYIYRHVIACHSWSIMCALTSCGLCTVIWWAAPSQLSHHRPS